MALAHSADERQASDEGRGRRFAFTAAQVKLIRATVARECTDAEFDHFIAVAERTGLDPLRRQINAIILNGDDPKRRSMLPEAGIDGLRAIAARHGDYRPMETEPLIEFDAPRKDEHRNPLGIVRAKVVIWKRFETDWFPIAGEAWWDEYAPVAPSDEEDNSDGPRRSRGGPRRQMAGIAANWRRMGRILIAKCAEAQALRRGWPEDLSGLYGHEELQRAVVEEWFASDRIARYEHEQSQRRLAGGNSLVFTFKAGCPPEAVSITEIRERIVTVLSAASEASDVEYLRDTNAGSFRLLWERDASLAHDIKKLIEHTLQTLARRPAHGPVAKARRHRVPAKTVSKPQAKHT